MDLQSTIFLTEISDDKSQYLHQIIKTYSKYLDVRFSLVAAKGSTFDQYEDKNFLLTPIVRDQEKFINLLRWHIAEIEERKKSHDRAELLFILVDEYSDFIQANPKVVEDLFIKIAKEGEAVNIFLMATTVHGDDPKVLISQLRECFKLINIEKKLKKILFFEDDQMLLSMFEIKMKQAGFNFLGFEHPLVIGDPLELVLKEKPDLIITSLTMPKMTGETLIEKLQADPRTKIYPIFCLTNHSEKSEILKIKSLGVFDYFVKAETIPSEICEAVQRFFNDRENYKKNIYIS